MNINERKHVKVTPGMARAAGKDPARICPGCGLSVPHYVGRYPTTCPDCGAALEEPKVKKESLSVDEQIAAVRRGVPVDQVIGMNEDMFGDLSSIKDKVKGAAGAVKDKAKAGKDKIKAAAKDFIGAGKAAREKARAKSADKAKKSVAAGNDKLKAAKDRLKAQQARAKELKAAASKSKSDSDRKKAQAAQVAISKTKLAIDKMAKKQGDRKVAAQKKQQAAKAPAKKPAAKKAPKKESRMSEAAIHVRGSNALRPVYPGDTLVTIYGNDSAQVQDVHERGARLVMPNGQRVEFSWDDLYDKYELAESKVREATRPPDDQVVGEVMLYFPTLDGRSMLHSVAEIYGSDYRPEFNDGWVLWSFGTADAARKFYANLTGQRRFGNARLIINGREEAKVGPVKWDGPLFPKTEAVAESHQRTPLDNQLPAIRSALTEMIRRDGRASLARVQATFRCNPMALRNVLAERAGAWGMIVEQDFVYPRPVNDQTLKG